ncbi:thymidine phosphorylase [Candidatus Poseidonia alphae]|nr:thymidine phosphorylase [Candidatus Poseidonia alphae]MDA8748650.1 thymidine phosphorylase [Candidatus Poseidonia alphae]MDA8758895.1 thymidine phosphorylase [Candidatus Poseidonia alphae]
MNVAQLIESVVAQQGQDHALLDDFVKGVANGEVAVEDATAWLKAVHTFGCSVEDTVQLTKTMIASGAQLTWEDGPPVVDKHSTGGVGDKMSLMLAPALAACGRRVPMLAGRGLGHTGGTIDKLESIPGFNCRLNPEEMNDAVNAIGCCIAVQNDAIAPADGVLYAIRDVTDTVDSVPLITASIISKKAAEGLQALVLDVKCGSAAFMKTHEQAEELAKSMVRTAEGLGIKTIAHITSMDQPIGSHVGNALEIIESIEVMQGKGSIDTRNLVILQGGALLAMTEDGLSLEEANKQIERSLDRGDALEKFRLMCIQQGVSQEIADLLVKNPHSVLPKSEHQTTVLSRQQGHVRTIDSMAAALLAKQHGAGRYALDDEVVPEIGFVFHASKGTSIEENQPLLTFHHNQKLTDEEHSTLQNLIETVNGFVPPVERLMAIVD